MVKQTGEQYQLLANGHNNNVVLAHSSKLSEPKNGQQFCQMYLREQACHIHKHMNIGGLPLQRLFLSNAQWTSKFLSQYRPLPVLGPYLKSRDMNTMSEMFFSHTHRRSL
jgi:hypothetical protein